MRFEVGSYVYAPPADPDSEKARASLLVKDGFVQTVRGGAARNVRFVEMIAAQTLMAGATGNLLARRPEMDFLLRLAGTTQISKAIQEAGSAKGSRFVLVAGSRSKLDPKVGLGGERMKGDGLSGDDLLKVEAAALLSAIRT